MAGSKRPGGGWWLGVGCALIIAYGWVQSSETSRTEHDPDVYGSSAYDSGTDSSPDQTAPAAYFVSPDGSGDESDEDASSDSGGSEPPSYAGSGACDSDYYLASSGDCVHRPMAAASVPDGASARCEDGTYSFSEHRSGTCSHHGGVEEWL